MAVRGARHERSGGAAAGARGFFAPGALTLALMAALPSAAAAQATPGVPAAITCAPGRVTTPHFDHAFDAAEVRASGRKVSVGLDHRYPSAAGQACAGTPDLVLETAHALEYSWARYEALLHSIGEAMPQPAAGGLPVRYAKKLRAWPLAAPAPLRFVHGARLRGEAIEVDLAPEIFSLDLHRKRAAHELYHFVQSRRVGPAKCTSKDGLWWIEAAAEYAAADVVWPRLSGFKGGGNVRAGLRNTTPGAGSSYRVFPYLLERPLAAHGAPTDDHAMPNFEPWARGEELEYDKGYFVQYLVQRRGFDFARLDCDFMRHYESASGADAALDALDRALAPRETLISAYASFAAWFLLGADGPLAGTDVVWRPGGQDAKARPVFATVRACPDCPERTPLAIPAALPAPLQYTFDLPAGHAARMWALESAGPRSLKVSTPLLADAWVRVFAAPRGRFAAGQPQPKAQLVRAADEATVALAPSETLYVVVIGVNPRLPGAAHVAIRDDAPAAASSTATGLVVRGPDNWDGESDARGFRATRRPAVRTRRNPPNHMSSPGEVVDSGKVTARVAATWARCPADAAALKKEVEGAALWRKLPDHASFEPRLVPFAVAGFEGFVLETRGVVTRYGASPYQDLGFPAAGVAGQGLVRRGERCLALEYDAFGGGESLGRWWDDMPFLKAHAQAAGAEARAMLAGLRVEATGSFTRFPHVPVQVPEGAVGPAPSAQPAPTAVPPPTARPAPSASAAPFELGRVWRVKQWIGEETWTWVWTRHGDSNAFEGVARHDRSGFESRHAIHFVSAKDGQVVLSRPDAGGSYVGRLSPDGRRVVSGVLDSVGGPQGWTAEIER